MIVGVDLSTHRIDLAWIQPFTGRPLRWHQELAGASTLDRIREIDVHWPVERTTIEGLEGDFILGETTEIIIEWPFGRSSNYLMAVVGILTHQAPKWARVSWLKTHDLRTAIGAKNTKADAHRVIRHEHGWMPVLAAWNEHELDALVTCLGGTHILEHPTNTKEPRRARPRR